MNKKNTTTTELAKSEPKPLTVSEAFTNKVLRQFEAEAGSTLAWTPMQRTLAQHLYLKIDATFQTLNAKRPENDQIKWEKVNMTKLALDAVQIVNLDLDALIPNTIHPIPYKNGKTGKFDIDLRIGYQGMDNCRRKMAVVIPTEVVYHLVYDTDKFTPHMRGRGNDIESYDLEITSPFNRGKIVGGFGYIAYDDPKMNRLVLVSQRDFARSQGAGNKQMWADNEVEMKYKTVVHRTTAKIPLDPNKVNAASYLTMEARSLDTAIDVAEDEAQANAGTRTLPQVAETSQEPADERVRDDEPTPEEIAEGEVVEAGQAGMAF